MGTALLHSWLKTALVVVATLLVLNTPLIIGVYCGRWDANDFFGPYYTLIADHARQGQLLLWTPLVDGGCPSGVDPQIGALSPLTVGMAAITGPSEFGFRCYWLLIWALGGLGMLCLARHLEAPLWAGFVAAIGYMFSGIYTGHAEHTTFLFVMSLLPWTLWRLDAAILTRRLRPAAEGGAFWGLAAMSGYPGLFFIGNCYLALWTLARVLESGHLDRSVPGRRLRSQKTILVIAVFLLVTAVVLAPVYVGFVCETRGYSDRSGPRSGGRIGSRCQRLLAALVDRCVDCGDCRGAVLRRALLDGSARGQPIAQGAVGRIARGVGLVRDGSADARGPPTVSCAATPYHAAVSHCPRGRRCPAQHRADEAGDVRQPEEGVDGHRGSLQQFA